MTHSTILIHRQGRSKSQRKIRRTFIFSCDHRLLLSAGLGILHLLWSGYGTTLCPSPCNQDRGRRWFTTCHSERPNYLGRIPRTLSMLYRKVEQTEQRTVGVRKGRGYASSSRSSSLWERFPLQVAPSFYFFLLSIFNVTRHPIVVWNNVIDDMPEIAELEAEIEQLRSLIKTIDYSAT